MRSSHADLFNHDEDADGYDLNVRDTEDPIRASYDLVLDWVIEAAQVGPESRILELGSGTGNLTRRIPPCRELVCVDVSLRMEAIALEKLAHLPNRLFIKDDVLAVFDRPVGTFDAIMSTYTIHHLTEVEKRHLFNATWRCLNPGGVAVFGDLMLERADARNDKIRDYEKRGQPGVAESIRDEFFWHLDESRCELRTIGFEVESRKFSDLSFGIVARRPGPL